MVTRRGLWLRRHMVIIIMLMFFISLTIILIPGWSAVLNKNQNITSVLHKTLTKSKQVLEQRYQHIQKLGKSIEHHYGDLKKWGKYLLTTNSIKRYKDLTCGKDTKPHRSIFYIKIHDTKSNILRNIFLIYGREYNLTVCMDAEKIWSANSPRKLDSVGLTKTKEERCQIVAEQLVYSTEIVDQIMADDVFVLASVRHPVQHFISVFHEMRILDAVRRLTNNKTLSEFDGMRIFLRDPKSVQKTYVTYEENNKDNIHGKTSVHEISLVQPNLQSFSLGITESASEEEFNSRLEEIHFIVVAEQFDESMLVLREKLCCTIEDLVYRKSSDENLMNDKTIFIPQDLQKLVLEFNKQDTRIYKHALSALRKELDKFDNLDQYLNIYRFEMEKYEMKCTNPKFPDTFKDKICPPLSRPGVGGFAMGVLQEQKERLLKKLRSQYANENRYTHN